MNLYTRIFRPFLMRTNPETVHHYTIEACRMAGALPPIRAMAGAAAMIYEGPGMVKRINEGLGKLVQRDGFKNVAEAVGADVVSSRG